jgi:peptidyl-prolyl cis-trans isomerase A (cyclophilin A)
MHAMERGGYALSRACRLTALVVAWFLLDGVSEATIVRFVTNLGNVDVRLYDTATPLHVANFLNYTTNNRYDDTFIHRSPEAFVVQGGGYKLAAPPSGIFGATHIPTFAAVMNEPGITNTRGSLALAKVGGNPNSGTSEWFFNMSDNSGGGPALDTQNGGFTVFGRVVGGGMSVLDAIQDLSRINTQQFSDVPVLDIAKVQAQQNVFTEDAVILSDVRVLNIPGGDYNRDGVVNAADLAVWKADFGSTTKVDADGNGNGRVDGQDFLAWQRTLGQNLGPPIAAAVHGVPEPSGLALVALGSMCAALRRRIP